MAETREAIVARIRDNLPFGTDPECHVCEDSVLANIGVNSLHLITMLIALQQEYSLDVDRIAQDGLPTTVGDLVTLVERGMPASEQR